MGRNPGDAVHVHRTRPRNAAEAGGVAICKKDTGGDLSRLRPFAPFGSAGKETSSGKTNANGQLAFTDLATTEATTSAES